MPIPFNSVIDYSNNTCMDLIDDYVKILGEYWEMPRVVSAFNGFDNVACYHALA